MDRGRGEPQAGSKRSFDDYYSKEGRRIEMQLHGRLEQGGICRQRERDPDRN
jgi:hypothetical protein